MISFLVICVVALCLVVSFYLGAVYGVYQTKRDYEIGKGVTPEMYEEMFDELYAKAYGTYHEVE